MVIFYKSFSECSTANRQTSTQDLFPVTDDANLSSPGKGEDSSKPFGFPGIFDPDVSKWSIDDVGRWLRLSNFEDLCGKRRYKKRDGLSIETFLSHSQLRSPRYRWSDAYPSRRVVCSSHSRRFSHATPKKTDETRRSNQITSNEADKGGSTRDNTKTFRF